ncbi:hemE [Symbiodinium pilosum]|uniref:HemE protein n=1 Tax=Symbiodinium pilosum TaxID=2952 RepID=A0A812VNV1_SYMPI|nr:hemE [Symbiodinium pilosum]
MEAHVDEALQRDELRPGEEEAVEMAAVEDDEEEEDDDEEMGEGGDEALDEDEDEDEEGGEMDQMDADGEEEEEHHGHDDGEDGDEDEEEGEYDEGEEEYDGDMDGDFGPDGQGIASVLQNAIQVFDQENPRLDGENMTFRVDIDLGEAGVIHGVHRGGQFRRMQMPPPPGISWLLSQANAFSAGNVGWADPGEMDAPHEHPLLRRDQSNMESHQSQLAQWMPPGNIRQFLGNVEPIIRTPSSLSAVPSCWRQLWVVRDLDFEAVFSEVVRRRGLSSSLQANFAVPEPAPAATAEAWCPVMVGSKLNVIEPPASDGPWACSSLPCSRNFSTAQFFSILPLAGDTGREWSGTGS